MNFTFAVDYDDVDGNPCVKCQVLVDMDQDGQYGEGERFDMEDTSDKNAPWGPAKYHTFKRTIKVTNESLNPQVRYRFYAHDGKDEITATGDPATNSSSFLTDSYVEVKAVIFPLSPKDQYEAVNGGVLTVAFNIALNYIYSDTVVLTWERSLSQATLESKDSGKEKSKLNFKHFSTAKSIYGEKLYTLIEAKATFDVPADTQSGDYHFVLPKLSYGITSTNAAHKGEMILTRLPVKIVSVLTEGPFLSRRGITVGDLTEYYFSFTRGAGVSAGVDEREWLEAFQFAPFEISGRHISKTRYLFGAERADFSLLFTLYQVPGSYVTPVIPISNVLLLDGDKLGERSLGSIPVELYSVDPPASIPSNFLQLQTILLSLKQRIKTMPAISRGGLSFLSPDYYLYAGLALNILIALALAATLVRMDNKRRGTRGRILYVEKFRERYEAAKTSGGGTVAVYHSLREYLLAAAGVDPGDAPQGFFGEELTRQFKLKEKLPKSLHALLCELHETGRKYFADTGI